MWDNHAYCRFGKNNKHTARTNGNKTVGHNNPPNILSTYLTN